MTDNQREVAETFFARSQTREEINDGLKQDHARRETAVKNLYRLRALRLERDAKINKAIMTCYRGSQLRW